MNELLTRQEVAELFRVEARTVTMWARKGLITGIRTPGSTPARPRYRYRADDIRRLLDTQSDNSKLNSDNGA